VISGCVGNAVTTSLNFASVLSSFTSEFFVDFDFQRNLNFYFVILKKFIQPNLTDLSRPNGMIQK